MESLGHFIFELVKIAILSFIYAIVLFFIYKKLPKYNLPKWLEKRFKSKKQLWVYISLFLLFYMFTPYGNHGLGDSARIPVSFTKEISNVNWTEFGRFNDVKSSEKNDLESTHFKVVNNFVCGNLKSDFYMYDNSYFIYDIKNEKLHEFANVNEYNEFAVNENLPKSNELKSFKENYSDYWNGWRFFLLP
jgi:hypothetical protein